MRTFANITELKAAVGEHFGHTEWRQISQEQVNLFADATGDHQWIHVDEERAKAGPFGTTIAHGFLTVSLLPLFNVESFALETPGARLNYGLNKVRFPHPVPVDSRLRSHVSFGDVTDLPTGKQLVIKHSVEIEGVDKPACVAELVVLLLA